MTHSHIKSQIITLRCTPAQAAKMRATELRAKREARAAALKQLKELGITVLVVAIVLVKRIPDALGFIVRVLMTPIR